MKTDFGFLFYLFSTKWQKVWQKYEKNPIFNLNSTPILFMRLPTNANRNFRKLTCSITIIRDLWKITQIGSIGLGIYFLPIYQLRLINLLRIHNLYPIFCRMNVWRKAFQEMCLRVLVSSSCLYLAREKRTLAFCWEGHKHKKEVLANPSQDFNVKSICQITNCFFVNWSGYCHKSMCQ